MNLEEVVHQLHPACTEVFKQQLIPAVYALQEALELNPSLSLVQRRLEYLKQAYISVWEACLLSEFGGQVANREYLREGISYADALSRVELAVKTAQEGRPESNALALLQLKAGIPYMISQLPRPVLKR